MNVPPADFHDATLVDVHLEWATGEGQFRFRTGPIAAERTVLLVGTTELNCPRRLPWARSVSVNSLSIETRDGRVIVSLEMQSGDTITATCASASTLEANRGLETV